MRFEGSGRETVIRGADDIYRHLEAMNKKARSEVILNFTWHKCGCFKTFTPKIKLHVGKFSHLKFVFTQQCKLAYIVLIATLFLSLSNAVFMDTLFCSGRQRNIL